MHCKWRTWIRHGGFAGWTWAGVLAGFAGALPDEDCDVVGVGVDRLDRAALLSSIVVHLTPRSACSIISLKSS